MNRAGNPYNYVADPTKGRPLFNSDLYFGVPDLDPEVPANQIQVYLQQEDGTPVAVSQPVETGAGGVPMYNGSPAIILIGQDAYSFKALDRNGTQVYYQENAEATLGGGATVGSLENYAAVRALNGSSFTQVSVAGHTDAGDGGGGPFYADPLDAVTADNGVTVLVDAGGMRWKRAKWQPITIEMCGGKADWNGSTGTDNSVAFGVFLSSGEERLGFCGGDYFFGNVANNQQKIVIGRDVFVDFIGAKVFCTGDNSVAGTDAAMFVFSDCRCNIKNLTFTDTAFTHAGPSRGVMPCLIYADSDSVDGHVVDNIKVIKGQSILTCATSDSSLYRSSGISVTGVADDVYYGINLSGNGDSVVGSVCVDTCFRVFFGVDVSGTSVKARLESGLASSANVLISSSGLPVTNIDLDVSIGEINGAITIADTISANGTGYYSNIRISAEYEAIGSNLTLASPIFSMGAYDGGESFFTVEKTTYVDDLVVSITKSSYVGLQDSAYKIYTPSANYGAMTILGNNKYNIIDMYPKNASNKTLGPAIRHGGAVSKSISGDLTLASSLCNIPSKYLSSDSTNDPSIVELSVFATNNLGNQNTYAKFSVIGQIDVSGNYSLVNATQHYINQTGGPLPAVTVAAAASGDGIDVSIASYSGAFAYLTASARYS